MRRTFEILLTHFFRFLAKIALFRHKPTIIAVTGNMGKTTTKDVIIAVLSAERVVAGTIRSQNSHLTTPLSVLGLEVQNKERRVSIWLALLFRGFRRAFLSRTFPEILVLEVGAGEKGDITKMAKWINPHISVFTAMQKYPVHLEHFNSREELFREKKELARYTRPGGTIIYNGDDEFLHKLLADCSQHKIAVGYNGKVAFCGYQNTPRGVVVRVLVRGYEQEMQLDGVWGEAYARSAALAIAVAADLDLNISNCAESLSGQFSPNPGRMRLLEGLHGTRIIDDSYNSSPGALLAALECLRVNSFPGRVICLLGDMGELGENSKQAHIEAGNQVAQVADVLVTVGQQMKLAARSAVRAGMNQTDIFECDDAQSAGAFLARMLRSGDVVLAKASRHGIAMERALVQLVEPFEKKKLVQEYL